MDHATRVKSFEKALIALMRLMKIVIKLEATLRIRNRSNNLGKSESELSTFDDTNQQNSFVNKSTHIEVDGNKILLLNSCELVIVELLHELELKSL